MTARIAFYFVAVVALVLFLAAAVPSHATQHRDPALTTPELAQKPQGAAPAHADPATISPRASARKDTTHKQKNSKKTTVAQAKEQLRRLGVSTTAAKPSAAREQ